MTSKTLYIIGAGGFGREIAWLVERINAAAKDKGEPELWELESFLYDNSSIYGNILDGYRVWRAT